MAKAEITNLVQLKKHAKKLFMQGESVESTTNLLWSSNELIISRTFAASIDELRTNVKELAANFAPYERIQQIIQNDLIAPTNRRSWFLHIRDSDIIILKNKADVGLDFLGKEYYIDYLHQLPVIYNPKKPMGIHADADGVKSFNNYKAPPWKSKILKGSGVYPQTPIPPIYDKFLTHITNGDDESKNFVLDWIAISLQARNQTYLCTIGTQGVGKGILGKTIAALHGKANSSNILFETISKQFNKPFADKTFVYLDEVSKVTKEQADKLKKQNDDEQEIELKGVDSEVVENFNNIYISSNHLEALRLEANDRRHSIINITDKRLETIFTHDQIRSLYEDQNLIEQFAYYLMNRKYNPHYVTYPFKSEQTMRVLQSSTLDWEKYFLDEVCKNFAGENVSVKAILGHIKAEFNKSNATMNSIVALSEKFPGIFEVSKTSNYKDIMYDNRELELKKPEGVEKRVFAIHFKKLNEQKSYEIREIED